MSNRGEAQGMFVTELLKAARTDGARELFNARQAVRAADADLQPTAGGPLEARSLSALLAAGPARAGGVASLGAIRLYREMRMASSIAASASARAASTAGTVRRDLDGTVLQLLKESDAAYVVITVPADAGARVPTMLELLGADGALARLPLPRAVEGVIQAILPRGGAEARETVRLIEDPATSMFLI